MTEYDLGKVVGDDGEAGNGIASITKTGTSGLVDTYTITYDDGTTTTFTVTNGSNASVTIQTSWGSTTSDSKVPSEKLTKDSLDNKASSTHTHGNLTNDGKVGSNANYFVVTGTSGAITSQQKIGNIDTSGKIGSTSGKPVITTTGGTVTTGSFGTSSGTFAEGNHTHSAYVNPTKVTSWSATVSDDNVASEKLIKDTLDTKQATLVSGTNIKTVNNESLLGSGNITIQGGSSVDVVTAWESTPSDSKVASEKLTKDTLDTKIAKSSTTGLMKNDGTVMTSGTGSSNWAVGNHTHSGYANSNHSHGYILNDGSVSGIQTPTALQSFSGFLGVFEELDEGYKIIPASFTTGYIKNTSALSNLGANANSTQAFINGQINTLIATKVTGTKVTSWSSTTSDDRIPSEKLVKDSLDDIEDLIGDAIAYINQ